YVDVVHQLPDSFKGHTVKVILQALNGVTEVRGIVEAETNKAVAMGAGNLLQITHNRFYVPPDVQKLRFDLKVLVPSPGARLHVTLTNVEDGTLEDWFVPLDTLSNGFVTFLESVPKSFQNHEATLSFKVENAGVAVVWLDNVFFDPFTIIDNSGTPDDD